MPTFNAEVTKKEPQDNEDKTQSKTPRIKPKFGPNDRPRNIKLTSSVLNPNRRHDLTANGPRSHKYPDMTLLHQQTEHQPNIFTAEFVNKDDEFK